MLIFFRIWVGYHNPLDHYWSEVQVLKKLKYCLPERWWFQKFLNNTIRNGENLKPYDRDYGFYAQSANYLTLIYIAKY